MILKLDLIGGIAGDMFIASVIDAFPDLESQLKNFLRKTFKKRDTTYNKKPKKKWY